MTALRWIDHLAARLIWLANVTILFSLGSVIYYASDRDVPYRIIASEPAEGYAGEPLRIKAQVWLNTEKTCDVSISRHVVDSSGVAWHVGESSPPWDMLMEMHRTTPGVRVISFDIPEGASPGPAILVSERSYRCNKVHALWPVKYVTTQPFTVLSR